MAPPRLKRRQSARTASAGLSRTASRPARAEADWLGEAGTKTPEETEMALHELLPKNYWRRINKLLVFYGQQLCRPTSPWCSRCVMAAHCARREVERSR